MVGMNVSDKWRLLTLVVSIIKGASDVEINHAFKSPTPLTDKNRSVRHLLSLRRLQLKGAVLVTLRAVDAILSVSFQDLYSMFLAHELPQFLTDCLRLGSMHPSSNSFTDSTKVE